MSHEISTEEMVMDGFRMMRNQNIRTAKQLRIALADAFPDVDATKIDEVMVKLANIALRMS